MVFGTYLVINEIRAYLYNKHNLHRSRRNRVRYEHSSRELSTIGPDYPKSPVDLVERGVKIGKYSGFVDTFRIPLNIPISPLDLAERR